ncbi:glycine cleavage system protein R [Novispirillum sp. DQ9]|uniref:glycine cleavage system protein R n=1 Tax=Novispirillum sp. DQ9 TaxID=3398612 RepID=UPI003C7BD781
MTQTVLVSLSCPDRTGLVAAVAGALFDLGANFGDATFAVLGEAAEFNALCEIPDDVTVEEVHAALAALPEAAGGSLSVTPFALAAVHGPSGRITHRITVSGGDRPGLIARLAEVFGQYGANIVRLNAERVPEGAATRYVVRIAISLSDAGAAEACLATVSNTAGELGLSCAWETA